MGINLTSGSFLESSCRLGLHNIVLMGLNTDWCVSLWVKPDLSSSSNNAYIFVKDGPRYEANETTPYTPYVHGYTNKEFYYNRVTQELVGIVYRGTGITNSTTTIPLSSVDIDGLWTHFVFMFDTTNGVKLYKNGVLLVGTTVAGSGTPYYDSYSEALGVNKWRFMCKDPDGIANRMNGGLAEVGIWGRILSDPEIVSLATNKNSLELVPTPITETWDYEKKTIPQEASDLAVWRLLNNTDFENYSEYVISDLSLTGSASTVSGPVGFDYTSPTVTLIDPVAGSLSPPLTDVTITFDEVVRGLTVYHSILPEQLLVDGSPATSVTGSGAGPYVFSGFDPPTCSFTVQLLGSGFGIRDTSGNLFVNDSWDYVYTYDIFTDVVPSGSGSITGDGTYDCGDNVTVEATANSPYVFKEWTEEDSAGAVVSTNASYSFIINYDRILFAHFWRGTLSVEAGNLTSSGYAGGPFVPSSKTYTITNTGDLSINWTVTKLQTWITLSKAGGTLASGASDTVDVTINANADVLPVGLYNDTVTFTNTTSHDGDTTRGVALTVNTPLTPGALSVEAGNLTSSGYAGGPFAPSSKTYTITNTGELPIDWTVAKVQTWVTLSKAGGTLAGGGTDSVTVSINSNADILAVGVYNDTVTFTNTTNHTGDTTRNVVLTVNTPLTAGVLSIVDLGNLVSSGDEGGPFTPSSKIYTLTNTGDLSINWTATKTQTWVTLSKASGTLAGGASDSVTVSINANADVLGNGVYNDTVTFTNTTNHTGDTTRGVNLTVNAPLAAGVLSIAELSDLVSSGYVGGPFSPSSKTYNVSNTGDLSIDWTVTKTVAWLTLSKAGGTLAGGASDSVDVTINANANALPAGIYNDTVTFTNTTNHNGDTTRDVDLTVNAAPVAGSLSIAEPGGLSSAGTEGGPFAPSSKTYTLSNPGALSIDWTAAKTQTWVTLSKTSGTLAGGGSDSVTVSINGFANTLGVGVYNDTVTFTNTTNHTGDTTRGVDLTITAAAPTIAAISDETHMMGSVYLGPTPVLTYGTAPITWSLVAGPSGMFISISNGVVVWPTQTIVGSPFTVTIRATNIVGSDDESWLLTIIPAPLVTNAGYDKTISSGETTTLDGSVSGGISPYFCSWTPITKLNDATLMQPTVSGLKNTTIYTLTVTDSLGVVDSDDMTVNIDYNPDELKIRTYFTTYGNAAEVHIKAYTPFENLSSNILVLEDDAKDIDGTKKNSIKSLTNRIKNTFNQIVVNYSQIRYLEDSFVEFTKYIQKEYGYDTIDEFLTDMEIQISPYCAKVFIQLGQPISASNIES